MERIMNKLAGAIAADILRERPEAPDFAHCFMCGRTFTDGKGHGLNGRFCSTLCLDGFDAGLMPPQPPRYSLPVRGDGFVITCKGCKRPFVSKGLRCCCPDHERKYREGLEIAGIVKEVGGELPTKRRCECCGGTIPRWLPNGRAVPKNRRFCSDRCAAKMKRAAKQLGG